MGTFTLPLKRVIELTGGELTIGDDGITRMTGGDIGLDYFKTHVIDHKDVLVGKIIDRYMNREIGQETIDMFQLAMRRKMNEIMPIYNQLYESELLEFNPLVTMKIKTLGKAENLSIADTTAVNISDSHSRAVASEFPQNMLAGNKDYATNATDSNGQSLADSEGKTTTTGNDDTEQTTEGYQAMPAELLMSLRSSFINIDQAIVDELSNLFMTVWDNNDSFTPNQFLYGGYSW